MDFSPINYLTMLIMVMAVQAFALQIEAPQEIKEQILIYVQEVNGESKNAILRASITKSKQCNNYDLKLINKNNGKTIRESKVCSANLPNAVLQNAVFELFGYDTENSELGGNSIRTALFGASFIVGAVLLYYSNPPKPVYGYVKNEIDEAAK
jgi:hypothetical protein